jgi:tetratricopeptide (TPR) repeat protein
MVCGWISSAFGAGPSPASATATATAKNSETATPEGASNYGGLVVAGIIAVLAAAAGAAIWRSHEAGVQKDLAVEAENRAVAARKNAEDIINYLLSQLRDRLEPLGQLDLIEDVQRLVETYHGNFGFNEQDPKALNQWAAVLQEQGDRLTAQGDMSSAEAKYVNSIEITRKLVKQDPGNNAWHAALAVRYEKVGELFLAQGDLNRARDQFRRLLEVQQKLAKRNPGDSAWQLNLLITYERLGEVLETKGDLRGAKANYMSSLDIMLKLVRQNPGNRAWWRDLSVIHSRLGGVLKAQGDLAAAKLNFHASVEILTSLIRDHGQNPAWEWDLDWAREQLSERS